MPRLFGVDIAGEINKALGPGLLDATLTKVVAGTRTGGSLTAGTNPTTTTHTAKGFIDEYSDFQRGGQTPGDEDNTLIQDGDRKVTLLGESIDPAAVPEAGDRVTIEGTEFRIIRVKRDPAGATYECQSRA